MEKEEEEEEEEEWDMQEEEEEEEGKKEEWDIRRFSELAMHNYNQRHQGKDEFKLVVPLGFTRLHGHEYSDPYLHLSFIAKNESTSILKMFFAEISHANEVLTCTIVEPGNPFFQSGCVACVPAGTIYHPLVYKRPALSFGGGYRRLMPYDKYVQWLLRKKYTIQPQVQKLNTEDVDKLKKAVVGYAHRAIVEYNTKNSDSYEYLEPVFCVRFRSNGYSRLGHFWAHLFFKAKKNDIDCTNDTPVLLFAELGLGSDSVSCVTMRNTYSGSLPNGCHVQCPIPHSENDINETGFFADCGFGDFADCWCEGQCWGVRSELQEETGVASENAWLEYMEGKHLPVIIY